MSSTAPRLESSRSSLPYGSWAPQGLRSSVMQEHELLSTLYGELKRTERFRRPFLLVLIDGGTAFRNANRGGARQGAIAALQAAARGTDMIGWYRQDTVLAAILPDVNSRNESVHAILKRIYDMLRIRVDTTAGKIGVSYHLYPEGAVEPEVPATLRLCPELEPAAPKPLYRAAKRGIDIALSLMALTALSPLLVLVAAAIKTTSKGPVLFQQVRLGRGLKRFTFLKFRSMYHGSSAEPHKAYVTRFINGDHQVSDRPDRPIYKLTNDSRVTPIGRLLRRTSIDELPQLLNVLWGNMSLVGPRPPLPYELEQYQEWHRRRLLHTKPGITGLWQVSGRSRTTFDEMVRLDLDYIENASLLLDMKILLDTPRAVFSREGAW